MPCCTAAVSTNGLNDDTACRWPCVARLNWRLRPSGLYETIALIAPVVWSMATSAAREREGVVGGRRLRQSRKQGCLRERQATGVAREVRLRSRLDARGVVPVADLVQVVGEDLVLGELAAELHRQAGLLDLAA